MSRTNVPRWGLWLSFVFFQTRSVCRRLLAIWGERRTPSYLQRGWTSLMTWTSRCPTTSSTLHTTLTSQVKKTNKKNILCLLFRICWQFELKYCYFLMLSVCHRMGVHLSKIFVCMLTNVRFLPAYSGSADRPVVSGDVQAGAADWLPLCGTGLLEGPTTRRGAVHHPRFHNDHWDLLQGGLFSPPHFWFVLIWHLE